MFANKIKTRESRPRRPEADRQCCDGNHKETMVSFTSAALPWTVITKLDAQLRQIAHIKS